MTRVRAFGLATLVATIGVILIGAVVRATGSGAGCGPSWPSCQGQVVPALEGATAVEFTHRAVSGIALAMVAILVAWVFRVTPRGAPARIGAVLSGLAILGEAGIGAAIVLFGWVGEDVSLARAISVPLHLVNTLLLLAALTLTIFWLSGGGPLARSSDRGPLRALIWFGVGMLAIGATGAVTALADTLFPKDALSFEAGEHFLTRLRVAHPVVAITIGVAAAGWAARHGLPAGGQTARASRLVIWAVLAALVAGVVNVLTRTPVWMQVVHLLLADLLWIAWVWLAATMLQTRTPDPVLVAE